MTLDDLERLGTGRWRDGDGTVMEQKRYLRCTSKGHIYEYKFFFVFTGSDKLFSTWNLIKMKKK